MSESIITISHNDKTKKVEVFVSGGDGTPARAIAEHIMGIVCKIQGNNTSYVKEIELN